MEKKDDDSFLKAIQIDKTILETIPYFIERNRRAADEVDINFQRQINTYRNKRFSMHHSGHEVKKHRNEKTEEPLTVPHELSAYLLT